MSLAGLRTVITGAASGIGQATAERFLAEGAVVAGLDLVTDGMPQGALPFVCDVSDDGSVRLAVASAAEARGGIDVVVNNAGIGAAGDVTANDDEEWHHLFDVNVIGMARVTRAALAHLRRSSHPAVVNMSSIVATAGLPNRVAYSASKGAVLAMTRAMAADHVGEGIRFNSVCPGTVDTPWIRRLLSAAEDPAAESRALEQRQPTGRLVAAPEIAAAVAYLADPASPALTGTEVAVDGGMAGLRPRR
jgi:2-keto-3-deoxy-L-fuconate dehydrogenase